MATKSSIHIKPCNITSSEAHNRRTPEYMRNIGDSKIYIVPELSADNEQWINPSFGNVALQTHYDNIKRMVKEKTGRAMQEKERIRGNTKSKTNYTYDIDIQQIKEDRKKYEKSQCFPFASHFGLKRG